MVYYYWKDNNSRELCLHPHPYIYLGHVAYSPLFLRSHYPSPNLPIWPPGSLTLSQPPLSLLGPKPRCGGGKEKGKENVAILGQKSC